MQHSTYVNVYVFCFCCNEYDATIAAKRKLS